MFAIEPDKEPKYSPHSCLILVTVASALLALCLGLDLVLIMGWDDKIPYSLPPAVGWVAVQLLLLPAIAFFYSAVQEYRLTRRSTRH